MVGGYGESGVTDSAELVSLDPAGDPVPEGCIVQPFPTPIEEASGAALNEGTDT